MALYRGLIASQGASLEEAPTILVETLTLFFEKAAQPKLSRSRFGRQPVPSGLSRFLRLYTSRLHAAPC